MTLFTFWSLVVTLVCIAGTGLYLHQAAHQPYYRPIRLLVAAVCAYGALLYGGSLVGLWPVISQYARPATALAFAALVWMGIEREYNRP